MIHVEVAKTWHQKQESHNYKSNESCRALLMRMPFANLFLERVSADINAPQSESSFPWYSNDSRCSAAPHWCFQGEPNTPSKCVDPG